MPTFNTDTNIQPIEYIPFNYEYETAYKLAAQQQAAENIATVKSRYETLLGMDLFSDKAKKDLSGFMKGVEGNLKEMSGMNMLTYDNVTKATDLFKPLTDPNGQLSYIAGEHAYAQSAKTNLSQIEASKAKGETYNQELEKIIKGQVNLYTQLNDPTLWKYFYNNGEDYAPSYAEGLKKELQDLNKSFRETIGEGFTEEKILNNGYKQVIQDKSIYADKYRQYLEQNLSDKGKRELDLQTRASYWETLNNIASIKDQDKRNKYITDLKTQYVKDYQNDIDQRIHDAEKVKNQYELYSKISSPNDIELVKNLNESIEKLDGQIKLLKEKKITEKDVEPMLDLKNWAAGQSLYSSFFLDKKLTNLADASAMPLGKIAYEEDKAYISLQNLNIQWANINLEQARIQETRRHNLQVEAHEGRQDDLAALALGLKYDAEGKLIDNNTRQEFNKITGNKISSTAEQGRQMYYQDLKGVANSKPGFDLLNQVTSTDNFTYTQDELKKMQGMNVQQAMDNGLFPKQNEVFNKLVSSLRVVENGKKRAIDLNKDKADYVLGQLKAVAASGNMVDFLSNSYFSNETVRKRLNSIKTGLATTNSLAKTVETDYKYAANTAFRNVNDKNGLNFAKYVQLYHYKLDTKENIDIAIKDFVKRGASPYSVQEIQDMVFTNYGNLRPNKKFPSITDWTRRKSLNEEGNNLYNNKVKELTDGVQNPSEINTFVNIFSDYVNDFGQDANGYAVRFTTNVPTADSDKGKQLLAAYNAMAKKDNEKTFKQAASPLEAIQNINAFFEGNRIPTVAIDPQKHRSDKFLPQIGNGTKIDVANITRKQLSSVYGLDPNLPEINVQMYNAYARGNSSNINMQFSGQYPTVKYGRDNKTILRDQNGNVLLDYVTGDIIKKGYVARLQASGLSQEDAEKKVNFILASSASDYVNQLGQIILGNLDLIKYLNSKEGKNINIVTDDLRSSFTK